MRRASSSKRNTGSQRRDEAISVVLDLAAADSPDRITTARISKEMKLSTGALFRHFPDKDALWEAVLEWATTRLTSRLEIGEHEVDSPLAALGNIFDAHLDFIAAHPGVPRLIFAELQRPKDTAAKRVVREFLRAYAQKLASLVRRGQATGEINPLIQPTATAALFIGSIQGLVMQSLLAADPGQLRKGAPEVRTLIFDHLLPKS
ncbi:MAG: TetR/AcrR family transcriptional regulator [Verrucomicrobiae bacterium]|nr:TetR/AcrR family transcriptional regulator [Verrucomicrobiae bacterium]